MLAQGKLEGFVFTTNYKRARTFYEKKLGFEFVSLDPYALVMKTAKNSIRIVKLPDFTPAYNTVLGWEVKRIEKVVAWLKERGVAFEDYPFIQDHESRIWAAPGGSRVAWFKDPDGNVLSVSEPK